LAGVVIPVCLNEPGKILVGLARLAKYFLVSARFVSSPWALFLPLEEVNAMMAVVAAFLLNS
jgi:hypothetical protein